ncbi:uncharacterized protein METZ01_LOCUS450625, partial [marine metagenome]
MYSNKQYSLVHQICLKVYENEIINDRQKEDALYFIALSSKGMFNDDVKYWLEQFLIEYPYSLRVNNINYELALYYFRNANYQKAISYFLTCKSKLDEYNFKLAYSYFVIDSIESAKYYYSKLLNKDSKYSSTSLYFYAHIAYKQKHYTTALSSFLSLKDDNNFASIIPYYISQIYFSQKRYDELISYAKP